MARPNHPCVLLAMLLWRNIILAQVAFLVPPPHTCDVRVGLSRLSKVLRSRLICSPHSTSRALRRRRGVQAQYCPLPPLPLVQAQIPVGTGMTGTIMRNFSPYLRHSSRPGGGARVGERCTCSGRTTLGVPVPSAVSHEASTGTRRKWLIPGLLLKSRHF